MEQPKSSKQENLLSQITKSCLRDDLPSLEVGERVEVITKIQDKENKEKFKLSSFKGIIIAQRRKKQISYNFTVLHESKINQKIRRAKLYFLERKLAARKAGIEEFFVKSVPRS
ncbi:9117_t:CDS:2 [Entrophospora sp. SA101]|nr:7810_t:CDS:2 [Entrophospora sp. SA101]CAJ0899324.1 9117_t:CDS:2 [Entrophospora sp. SA101]